MKTDSIFSEKLCLKQLKIFPIDAPVWTVMDTDTFNEIDDQFALAYAVRSPDLLNLKAVTAAPFYNSRSNNPADGMKKSYQEILRIMDLLEDRRNHFVFPGATTYLPDRKTPVDSPAARRLVELARLAKKEGRTLFVLAIAAITNVASALLLAPDIRESMTVIWLGGHAVYAGKNDEFNLYQDVPAAQTVFDSGVPLVQIPCKGVAELLMTNIPALEHELRSCGKIGEFLLQRCREYLNDDIRRGKVIWDIAATAFLVVPEAFQSELVPAPKITDDGQWMEDKTRPRMRRVVYLESGQIFNSLFQRLRSTI